MTTAMAEEINKDRSTNRTKLKSNVSNNKCIAHLVNQGCIQTIQSIYMLVHIRKFKNHKRSHATATLQDEKQTIWEIKEDCSVGLSLRGITGYSRLSLLGKRRFPRRIFCRLDLAGCRQTCTRLHP